MLSELLLKNTSNKGSIMITTYKNLIVLSLVLLAPLGYVCGTEGAEKHLHDVPVAAETAEAWDFDDIDNDSNEIDDKELLKKPDITVLPKPTDEEIRAYKVIKWFQDHNLFWVLKALQNHPKLAEYLETNPKKSAAIAAAGLAGTIVSIAYLIKFARMNCTLHYPIKDVTF